MAAKKRTPHVNDVVNLSLRLEKAQYKRLRMLAFDTEASMHSLIVEAIEKLLKAEKR